MKFVNILSLAVLILMLVVNLAFSAGTNNQITDKQWITTFPVGMNIYDFAVDPSDPNVLYATNFNGVFKSLNGGRRWTPLSYESQGEKTNSFIRISPVNAKTIFWFSRLFLRKSVDSGLSWSNISLKTINDDIKDVTINPVNSEIFYIAARNGLFKTLNGGKSFGTLLKTETVHAAVNPSVPDEVYASYRAETWNNPALLHRSSDGGMSFRDKVELIDPTGKFTYNKRDHFLGKTVEQQGYCHETYVSINPSNPVEILASCNTTVGGGNTWQRYLISKDGAHSWKLLDSYFESEYEDVGLSHAKIKQAIFHPKLNGVIYAIFQGDKSKGGRDKIFRTEDQGVTWKELGPPPSFDFYRLRISSTGTLYLNTYLGLYKSDNDGTTWESVSHGLPTIMGNKELLHINEKTGTVYVGGRYGYYTSDLKAETWSWTSIRDKEFGFTEYSVSQIIPTVNDITYLLAGNVLFKRTSDGKNERLSSFVKNIAVSPSYPNIIYSVRQKEMYDEYKIVKSDDGGFSWAEMLSHGSGYSAELFVGSNSPDTLFVVTSARRHVLGGGGGLGELQQTNDGGKTWSDLTNGLYKYFAKELMSTKAITEKNANILAKTLLMTPDKPVKLSFDPGNTSIIYLSFDLGLFRYNLVNKTWKLISPDSTFLQVAAKIVPKEMKNNLTLESDSGRVARQIRNNKGVSYNDISSSVSTKSIYLSTNKGVYISTNFGDTWTLLNKGLYGANVNKVIAVSSLVLAESYNGIYKFVDINELGETAVYKAPILQPISGTPSKKELSVNTTEEKQKLEKIHNIPYTDPNTGIMWAQNGNIAGKHMKWMEATEWVNNLNYQGYSDWRLPTKEELESYAKRGGEHPSEWFNANGFFDVQANGYWSSTISSHSNYAWGVNMYFGYVSDYMKNNYYYVWPVRGGK